MTSRKFMLTGPLAPLSTIPVPLVWKWVLFTTSIELPAAWLIPVAPPAWKPKILLCSTCTAAAAMTLIPIRPVPMPSMSRPRRLTTTPAPLTLIALVPAARMPPNVPVQSMVIDLVIVTAPNPPGSRQLMMPPATVFEMAPGKVLHGAVRLHGFTSSPTPETQVRVACACAGEPQKSGASAATAIANTKADCFLNMVLLIVGLLCGMLMRSPLVRARPNPAARRNERPPFLGKRSFGEVGFWGSVLVEE